MMSLLKLAAFALNSNEPRPEVEDQAVAFAVAHWLEDTNACLDRSSGDFNLGNRTSLIRRMHEVMIVVASDND